MNKSGPVKVAMIGLGWWGKKMARAVRGEASYPSREKTSSTTSPFLKPPSIGRQGWRGGEALIRTMQDMKALISETPEKPIIADIPMPPIKVTLSARGLN
jgi:hypothetical protein